MFDVSIIIPNFNGGRFLSQAIDSALNQKGVKVEVIVVDDGSTDNSHKILKTYGNIIKVFYQENSGAPSARNLGWKNADSEYIKFLDADDVLIKDTLHIQLANIKKLNTNQIIYGQGLWVNENLDEIKNYPVKPILENENPVFHILTQNPLTSSVLHRKVLLERIGGFDEFLVRGQEFDLHLRLVLEGVEFIYQHLKVYFFRQHNNPERISGDNTIKYAKEIFDMCSKQVDQIKANYDKLPIEIRVVLAKRYWSFGRAILRSGNKSSASKFFFAAKKLHKIGYSGNKLYQIFTLIFGPYTSEKIFNHLHKMKNFV